MKSAAAVAALLALAGSAFATPVVDCFAFDTFDSNQRLLSFTQSPAPGAFTSPGDGFEVYQRGVSANIPFALLDDTNAGFPADTLGIVKSTKLDRWFGVTDLANDDNLSGQGMATWTFDISSYMDLSISIDMAAMGDFEATGLADINNWSYSIDGGALQALFTSSVDENASQTYTLESGAQFTLDDPMLMNGTTLNNDFQTLSAAVLGTGSVLTLQYFSQGDGGTEAYVFDNIQVCGVLIPTPGATALLGLAGLAGLRRRR